MSGSIVVGPDTSSALTMRNMNVTRGNLSPGNFLFGNLYEEEKDHDYTSALAVLPRASGVT